MNESFLYHIWDARHFYNKDLTTNSGKKIQIIYPGTINHNKGPDFKFARIILENKLLITDIEIEIYDKNFKEHKHHINPDFKEVHLVVCYHSDPQIKTICHQYRKNTIEILTIDQFLTPEILQILPPESIPHTFCPIDKNHQSILVQLKELGLARINQKLNRFIIRYKDLSTFDELIYQGILESLGYSNNKYQFLNLSKHFPYEKIKTILQLFPPKEHSTILKYLFLYKTNLKNRLQIDKIIANKIEKYQNDIKIAAIEIDWNLFRIRPQNHPIRRLIYISEWLPLTIEKGLTCFFLDHYFSEGNQMKNLFNSLTVAKDEKNYFTYHWGWRKHKTIKPISFLGENRKKDIIFNIILPLLQIFFQQEQNLQEVQNLKKMINHFPSLQTNFAQQFLLKRYQKNNPKVQNLHAIEQQGILYLYEHFCKFGYCDKCVFDD